MDWSLKTSSRFPLASVLNAFLVQFSKMLQSSSLHVSCVASHNNQAATPATNARTDGAPTCTLAAAPGLVVALGAGPVPLAVIIVEGEGVPDGDESSSSSSVESIPPVVMLADGRTFCCALFAALAYASIVLSPLELLHVSRPSNQM